MFSLAQQAEKIKSAPYIKMLQESKPRQGLLSHSKYPELLEALPTYLRLPTMIGFHTGMRLGEVLGLKWENVSWNERVLRLLDTKNGDLRDVPFGDELEAALKRQFVARQPGCEFVCFRVNRQGHAEPIGDFRKVWRRVCVQLGLAQWDVVPVLEKPRYVHSKPKPKVRYNGLLFHDLRRTFITDAETAGAPRHEVMKLSGHKTESVYKRYAIGSLDPRRAALEKIHSYRSEKRYSSGTISEDPEAGDVVTN